MGLILPSQLLLAGVPLLCSTGLPLEGRAGPMGGVGEGLQRVDPSIDCWTLLFIIIRWLGLPCIYF